MRKHILLIILLMAKHSLSKNEEEEKRIMQEYYDEFTGSLTEEEYQELAEKQMFEDRVNEYW